MNELIESEFTRSSERLFHVGIVWAINENLKGFLVLDNELMRVSGGGDGNWLNIVAV